NVLFLVVVAGIFLQVQLRLGVNALLSGRADERLQTLSGRLSRELDLREQAQWAPPLQQFAAEYHVQIAVFSNDGPLLAGTIDPLPQEVLDKLTDKDRPPEQRPRPEPPPRREDGPP